MTMCYANQRLHVAVLSPWQLRRFIAVAPHKVIIFPKTPTSLPFCSRTHLRIALPRYFVLAASCRLRLTLPQLSEYDTDPQKRYRARAACTQDHDFGIRLFESRIHSIVHGHGHWHTASPPCRAVADQRDLCGRLHRVDVCSGSYGVYWPLYGS
jgi:hypothetical protein